MNKKYQLPEEDVMTEVIAIVAFGFIAGVAYFQSKKNREENQSRMAAIWMIFSLVSVALLVVAVISLVS
jgi:uncharacterized membrane protein